MKKIPYLLFTTGSAVTATVLLALPAAQKPLPDDGHNIYSIGAARIYTPASYAFMRALINNKRIVCLGESLHLTYEFPLIRVAIIKELNTHSGFGTVALEGSPVDLWVTQDQFLRSDRGQMAATRAMGGLFRIWNTSEMLTLFEYESSTWATSHPLYLTSYDIQPGNGVRTSGKEVFSRLYDSLASYAKPPVGLEQEEWIGDLDRTRCIDHASANDPAALYAIGSLRKWINVVAPKVKEHYPFVPHADVLRLIPDNLVAALSLCDDGPKSVVSYAQTREEQAARYAVRLQSIMPENRLIVWAHAAHVGYFPGSFSSHLRELLGDTIYSVGLLPNGGSAFVIFSNPKQDVGFAFLNPYRGALGALLARNHAKSSYIDFSHSDYQMFHEPQRLILESSSRWVHLPTYFDACIWVRNVHPARLPLRWLVLFAVWHYRYIAGSTLIGSLVIVSIVLGWR